MSEPEKQAIQCTYCAISQEVKAIKKWNLVNW